MSLFGVERSNTASTDIYDHAINLVDSTKPKDSFETATDDASRSTSVSDLGVGQPVTRQFTTGHLRKELARRKYAKWQEEKEPDPSIQEVTIEDNGLEAKPIEHPSSNTARTGRKRDKIPFRSKKKAQQRSQDHETFIDVLYENQRGWWACGIPLYSSNSLLQFDAAAWQTSTFQDSPVNITNAQVPDPSWRWAWKSWYVDMSYDVDEEGWQYSFSFNSQFAWHGNHPWYHSYVRRRRWLRKRVKKGSIMMSNQTGKMKDAHRLNPDYFTIHPSGHDRSRGSSADRATTNGSSLTGALAGASEADDDIQEIEDIAALLAALKKARMDREKITSVKIFLDQGGEELHYLADTMPTILDDLVHQSSRRQLQLVLLQGLDAATKARKESEGDKDEDGSSKRRVENILKAVHAANVHENDVEYWSDLRSQSTGFEAGPTNERHDIDATEPSDPAKDAPPAPQTEDRNGDAMNEIRGLPDDSHFQEPHVGDINLEEKEQDDSAVDAAKTMEKGKGRA